MNLLLGHFDSPIDDDARDVVFDSLRSLRRHDYPTGEHHVRLSGALMITIRIEHRDAVMLRLVDRILRRVLEEHLRAFEADSTRTTPGDLLRAGWRALAKVRAAGYQHGRYEVTVDGEVIQLRVGRWDATLIRQCDEFLLGAYRCNWWIFNEVLAGGQVASSHESLVEWAA